MFPLVSDETRLRMARGLVEAIGMGTYALGALAGLRYLRFLGLRSVAAGALARGDLKTADELARELLALAVEFRSDWNYGNAVHHGHTILGLLALKRNQRSQAIVHLHESGRIPGSPQLRSFGPSMVLAEELLNLHETRAVMEYFRLCRKFWTGKGISSVRGEHPLDEWERTVRAGNKPDFGPNLAY